MKPVDLLVYRQYDFRGVKVVARIDRLKKQVSLVEHDDGAIDKFAPKSWLFAERGAEYMNGWRLILMAMDHAIVEAQKELEKFDKEDTDKLVQMFIHLDKVKKEELK